MVVDRNYTYDDNGNLKSDSKRGMNNTVYGWANLPWTINMVGTNDVDYLYDVNDSRIYKTKVGKPSPTNEFGIVTISEYYLKSSAGQDIGIYDFNSDELTWYIFGKERIAKFKHQYEDVLQKVTNDVSSIPLAGMNQELIDALAPLHEWNSLIQKSEFTLPNTLLLIHLTSSNTYTYVLQSHLDFIDEDYTEVASYDITEETNQFAFTMSDGTIGYFSLEELFDMLGLVANNITLSPSIDPFDIPLNVPTTVHEPDFYYYNYDHLGNTRIVYSTTIPNCGNPEYTLEAVMDYFPYGKTLREFIKTPEKYVTTHHERDVETGLDYRGARFYDSDVARFLSLDPHAASYPELSDYCYVAGNPVMFVDLDGKDYGVYVNHDDGTITIQAHYIVPENDKKLMKKTAKYWNGVSGDFTYQIGEGLNAKNYTINFNITYEVDSSPLPDDSKGDWDTNAGRKAQKASQDNPKNELNSFGTSSDHHSFIIRNFKVQKQGAAGGYSAVVKKGADKPLHVAKHEIGHTLGMAHTIKLMAWNYGASVAAISIEESLSRAGVGSVEKYGSKDGEAAKANLQSEKGQRPQEFHTGNVVTTKSYNRMVKKAIKEHKRNYQKY